MENWDFLKSQGKSNMKKHQGSRKWLNLINDIMHEHAWTTFVREEMQLAARICLLLSEAMLNALFALKAFFDAKIGISMKHKLPNMKDTVNFTHFV